MNGFGNKFIISKVKQITPNVLIVSEHEIGQYIGTFQTKLL